VNVTLSPSTSPPSLLVLIIPLSLPDFLTLRLLELGVLSASSSCLRRISVI
jgi:hypothetical protein